MIRDVDLNALKYEDWEEGATLEPQYEVKF